MESSITVVFHTMVVCLVVSAVSRPTSVLLMNGGVCTGQATWQCRREIPAACAMGLVQDFGRALASV
jgi:hypothetical protein